MKEVTIKEKILSISPSLVGTRQTWLHFWRFKIFKQFAQVNHNVKVNRFNKKLVFIQKYVKNNYNWKKNDEGIHHKKENSLNLSS